MDNIFVGNFKRILDSPQVMRLILDDPCGLVCDQYILAMIYMLFLRANIRSYEEMQANFFAALSLAHVMVDKNSYGQLIIWFYAKPNDVSTKKEVSEAYSDFTGKRFILSQLVKYKGSYEKDALDLIINENHHIYFKREASRSHMMGDYLDINNLCPICRHPMNKMNPTVARLLDEVNRMKLKRRFFKASE